MQRNWDKIFSTPCPVLHQTKKGSLPMPESQPSLPQTGTVSLGTQRQMEVYLAGITGKKPSIPVSVEELEQKAREVMTPEAYGYVAGSAGSENSARANLEGFKRWRIVPRFLRDVSKRDLRVSVLGQQL